jgi:hypothetical protein
MYKTKLWGCRKASTSPLCAPHQQHHYTQSNPKQVQCKHKVFTVRNTPVSPTRRCRVFLITEQQFQSLREMGMFNVQTESRCPCGTVSKLFAIPIHYEKQAKNYMLQVQHNDFRNSTSAVLLEPIRALDTVSARFHIVASRVRADHIPEHRKSRNVPQEQALQWW